MHTHTFIYSYLQYTHTLFFIIAQFLCLSGSETLAGPNFDPNSIDTQVKQSLLKKKIPLKKKKDLTPFSVTCWSLPTCVSPSPHSLCCGFPSVNGEQGTGWVVFHSPVECLAWSVQDPWGKHWWVYVAKWMEERKTSRWGEKWGVMKRLA